MDLLDQFKGRRIPWPKVEGPGVGAGKITVQGSDFVERLPYLNEPQQITAGKTTESHCHACDGKRTHDILHSDQQKTKSPFEDTYIELGSVTELLKCRGCNYVSMRKTSRFSDDLDENGQQRYSVEYFPPEKFKPLPRWLEALQAAGRQEFIFDCLAEAYNAFSSGNTWLSCIGVRSILEQEMVKRVSDQGTFQKNLKKFQNDGFIGENDRKRLDVLIEAGHASTHRAFKPARDDVSSLLDLLSNLLEKLYYDEAGLAALKLRIPPRVAP
jgi:hypothetical protein